MFFFLVFSVMFLCLNCSYKINIYTENGDGVSIIHIDNEHPSSVFFFVLFRFVLVVIVQVLADIIRGSRSGVKASF